MEKLDKENFIVNVVKECRKDSTLLPLIVSGIQVRYQEELSQKSKVITVLSFLSGFLFTHCKSTVIKYKKQLKLLIPYLLYYYEGTKLGEEIKEFISEQYKDK